jgi:hypothetical protein
VRRWREKAIKPSPVAIVNLSHPILASICGLFSGSRGAHAVAPMPVSAAADDDRPRLPARDPAVPPWLQHWRRRPRHPLWEAGHPDVVALIRAAELSLPVRLVYFGGSTPGLARWFTPSLVFQVHEMEAEDAFAPVYVSGWCHVRQAHRTLRLDRLQLIGARESASPSQTARL